MDRARAAIAVVIAVLLAVSAELAQPGGHQQPAVPPATDGQDASAMAGERLPLVAAHHLPTASWAPAPLPWVGSRPGADGTTTNSHGHLPMQASSSLSPVLPQLWPTTSQESVPGASYVANNEPAKTAGTVDEETGFPRLLNPDVEPWFKNPCVLDRHDFRTGGRMYRHMLYLFDMCLITWTKRRSSEHWVLCPEPNEPTNHVPCGYVILPLRGEGFECALAFRADNVDLVAFANGRNEWHVFPKYAHLIPTATVLEFDNDYSDLLETGDDEEIMSLPLGGTSLLQATSYISLYMKAPGNSDEFPKEALATVTIGIRDAKRFSPVRELIVNGWLEGTRVNETMVKYLSSWMELSCAVLVAEKGRAWGSDKYSRTLIDLGIAYSKQDASDILDVLLLSQDTESNDCP